MAKKTTELPAIDSVASDDVIAIVDTSTGVTKKATVSQLPSGAGGATPGGSAGDIQVKGVDDTFEGYTLFGAGNIQINVNDEAKEIEIDGSAIPEVIVPGDVGDIPYSDGAGGFGGVYPAVAGELADTEGTQAFQNKTIDAVDNTIRNLGNDNVKAAQAVAALAVDWAAGTVFTKSISANSTFTFSNASSGMMIVLRVTSSGSYTVTWPAGIRWPGGTTPTQTASGTDVYTFFHDGSNIYGSAVQNMS